MRIKFANASRQFAAATLVDDLLVPATGGGDAHHGCPLNNARFQNRTIRYRPVPANFGWAVATERHPALVTFTGSKISATSGELKDQLTGNTIDVS